PSADGSAAFAAVDAANANARIIDQARTRNPLFIPARLGALPSAMPPKRDRGLRLARPAARLKAMGRRRHTHPDLQSCAAIGSDDAGARAGHSALCTSSPERAIN